jgi:hypothetical protein
VEREDEVAVVRKMIDDRSAFSRFGRSCKVELGLTFSNVGVGSPGTVDARGAKETVLTEENCL